MENILEKTENDRLRAIIEKLESSDVVIAKEMGVGVSTVSACTMKGRDKLLSRSFYKKFMAALPFVNEYYLDEGKGKMFNRKLTKEEKDTFKKKYQSKSNTITKGINKAISQRHRELREHYNDTQLSFGERLGVDRGMITSVESARQNPSLNYIELLERKTKINLYWLLLGRGDMFGSRDASDGANKVEVDKLNDTIEEQRLLIKMLREENAKGFSH